jgi:hypothetical protein
LRDLKYESLLLKIAKNSDKCGTSGGSMIVSRHLLDVLAEAPRVAQPPSERALVAPDLAGRDALRVTEREDSSGPALERRERDVGFHTP